MKFWNKDKDVRQRCWSKVSLPSKHGLWVMYDAKSNADMKLWCQQHESNSKFYFYYGSNNWWFQDPADAIIFKLKFG